MEKLLDKIEEYKIFNYIIPGMIFTYLLKYYVGVDILQKNVIEMFFIYYFIGLTISRIGSLFLEEICKKLKFIEYSDYKDFIEVSNKDKKIDKLLESNNMFRTLCSTLFVILLIKIIKVLLYYKANNDEILFTILIIIGIIIYLFAYRKQTKYICERIKANKK